VRIGCSEPLAAVFVPTVIEGLLRRYPRVAFSVVTADPATLTARELRQRNIDLAIMPIPGLVLDADMNLEVLFDDRQLVMAAPQNKWFRRRGVTLADLVHEPWMQPPPDSIIGSSIVEVFRASGLEPPRSRVVTFSIPLCHHLLAGGSFFAMLPVSMARLGRRLPLKILNVGFRGIPRPTGIITLKKRTPSPLTELFISEARKLAKPLAKEKWP
jgi:DNA-binding transcriptional LysR family regulator